MIRSTDRILTTHTGSLPRPDDLIRMMFAKEEGIPVDKEALGECIASTVSEIVCKQIDLGIDIVNDGEVSKPSYATYIKDRLNGFGGESQRLTYQDLVEFPSMARRVFDDPGRARRQAPGCNGQITIKDKQAVLRDVANLQNALVKNNATGKDFFTGVVIAGISQAVSRFIPATFGQELSQEVKEKFKQENKPCKSIQEMRSDVAW